MKQLITVAKETYLRQVKSWSFLVLVLSPFLFLGLTALGGALGASIGDDAGIALVAPKEVADHLSSAKDFERLATEAEAEQSLKDEDISGYVVVSDQDGQMTATYHGKEEMSERERVLLLQDLGALQVAANQAQAGLNQQQAAILSRQVVYEEKLSQDKGVDQQLGQTIAFYILVFVLYFLLLTYSSVVSQEVAGEKGTKIMEMIFSSVRSDIYFYGKMLGMFGVVFTHIAIYVVGFSALSPWLMAQDFIQPAKGVIRQVLSNFDVMTLGFILLALIFYISLSALCGSLVSRPEDAGKAAQPVGYLVLIGFIFAFMIEGKTDQLLAKVMSYIPVTSPFVMPMRLIEGHASVLEGWLSLGVLAGSAVGVILFIGRNYGGFALQTDQVGLWKTFTRGLRHQ